jgi:hypothetical protein
MSDKSAAGMGGKKWAFNISYLASGVVAGPVSAVKVGIEEGVGGRKLLDLAHLARRQMLFSPSLLAFSSASSKLLSFAAYLLRPLGNTKRGRL